MGFEEHMKLEAVDPLHPNNVSIQSAWTNVLGHFKYRDAMQFYVSFPNNDCCYFVQIYAATVEKIVEPIMFLTFDKEENPKRKIITGINSFNSFSVGWCAMNGYPLQTPVYRSKSKSAIVVNSPEKVDKYVLITLAFFYF